MRNINLRKKSGFTLIEIIIVVIILGILAAIALPRVTSNFDKAKATESFNFGGEIGKGIDRCYAPSSDMTSCDTWSELGITQPANNDSAYKFVYTIAAAGAPTADVVLTSKLKANTGDSTGSATDTITFTYTNAGKISKACAGVFSDVCK